MNIFILKDKIEKFAEKELVVSLKEKKDGGEHFVTCGDFLANK